MHNSWLNPRNFNHFENEVHRNIRRDGTKYISHYFLLVRMMKLTCIIAIKYSTLEDIFTKALPTVFFENPNLKCIAIINDVRN